MRGRRRKGNRVYWRGRGEKKRAWANFDDYADVGGRREPLVPSGAKLATTDPVLAETLAADRLKELEAARRGKILTGVAHQATLSQFAEHHARGDPARTRLRRRVATSLGPPVSICAHA